jgi:hypothetical protein
MSGSLNNVVARAKSKFALALDEIQNPLTGLLKNIGFRRKGRSYNRMVADRLVQVVNLQMGEFPIGDYVIPGLRESYYGRFTVNLGVFLPAVLRLERSREPPAFVQEYECEIRARLGSLVYGEDTWWDLDHGIEQTAAAIVEQMDRTGVPFLEQFEDYASVLSHLERTGTLPSSNEGRSALAGALICCELRDRPRAGTFFDRAAAHAEGMKHRGFLSHVTSLRAALMPEQST